ncbi:MAG: flagellar motor switch protein FliN [Planctomycetes bacterium]|nr:flagellar motor switch protein FliN [Planctomycetota bacterium]
MSETSVNPRSNSDTKAVPLQAQDLPALNPTKAQGEAIGLDHLMDVTVPLTVELGRTRISIAGLSQFAPGSLVTLEREAHEPVDVLVNGKLVAKGEVVTIGSRYGVRITSMISG